MQANVTVQLLNTFPAAAGVAVGQLDEGDTLLAGPFLPELFTVTYFGVFSVG